MSSLKSFYLIHYYKETKHDYESQELKENACQRHLA